MSSLSMLIAINSFLCFWLPVKKWINFLNFASPKGVVGRFASEGVASNSTEVESSSKENVRLGDSVLVVID